MSKPDILIRGGQVIDGTGARAIEADVAIADGRIAAVAPKLSGDATRVIDARGLVVAPGFIDIKTHSDWTLPLNVKAESKIRQGVTTEVIGHCGYSCAPVLPGKAALLRDYLSPSAPWLSFIDQSFADYLGGFPATSTNVVPLVGHNTLRLMVMGLANRRAGSDELEAMAALLEAALDAGAYGFSTGLFTPPGAFAATDEIVALAKIVRAKGGRYFTHLRDEANAVFDALDEAITVGREAGVHVQVVHLKLSGLDNWGKAGELLERLESARKMGVAIDCDQYPYTAASNPLKNLLSRWVQSDDLGEMQGRLAEPANRTRIRHEIAGAGLNNFGRIKDWDAIRISVSPNTPQFAGRTMGELAREVGADPVDRVCDYLIADKCATRVLVDSISEDDIQTMIRSPHVCVGSDGNCVAPYGVTGQGRPHPRFYGTFPRILGHYCRDLGLIDLPRAIWKMTGLSAQALGFADRGLLRPGYAADVTIFDPAEFAERASYADPHQYPAGQATTVLVNGTITVDHAEHTGALAGKLLRRAA
ncbi:MAG TPA: D-aminoacylase [Stellaceae bacterium]|jgi:N-acyl-D-aspartate/D-glutamate deacylase|nr:D-aminoacylase [Stellaceae bacterium]